MQTIMKKIVDMATLISETLGFKAEIITRDTL